MLTVWLMIWRGGGNGGFQILPLMAHPYVKDKGGANMIPGTGMSIIRYTLTLLPQLSRQESWPREGWLGHLDAPDSTDSHAIIRWSAAVGGRSAHLTLNMR